MTPIRNLAAIAGLVLGISLPAMAAPVKTAHVALDLVAQTQGVTPGGQVVMALSQDIQTEWHTYWRNSGDSGAPTELKWTLPAGWTAGDIVWAPPTRQPTGPLMNYGYAGKVLLPVILTAPKSAKVGDAVVLKAHASVLVCADVCVPEDADLSITLPVVAADPVQDPVNGPGITAALAATPKSGFAKAVFSRSGKTLKLAVFGEGLKGANFADSYFYPYAADLIDHAKPQLIERGPGGLTFTLTPGFGKEDGPAPATMDGVVVVAGHAFEISGTPGVPPPEAAGLGPPPAKVAAPAAGDLGLVAAIAFAFVGGLILNLMPCVFPILAMKATSLAGHAHNRKEAQAQGLAFLAGAVFTFLALAGVLIAVRAGGAAVGWGFQLQSPPVVAGLALLMLAVALNLSGLFEIGSSLQGLGAEAASRGGLAGAFLTGALAVVVAAPCTAPFMAPALGWALVQPPLASLAVFLGLGLGFAAPFTLAAFIPGLLARLPKPGGWMEGFRRLMAFPMYGTAAWLAWVLAVQSGSDALARVFAAAVILALGVWLLGSAQHRAGLGQRPVKTLVLGVALSVAAFAAALWPNYAEPTEAGAEAQGSSIPYEAYSPAKLAEVQATGRPVFINYTAAWCVTCQVNEKVAFSTRTAAAAFEKTGAVYLKADWTRRDAVIAEELARHGRAGVPLYLVYPASGGEPVVLPQILTGEIVAKALDAAARS